MRTMRGVAVFAVALVLSACGGSSPDGPTPTPTQMPAAAQPAPAAQPVALTMALPSPTTDASGTRIEHSWTGGPHGWDTSCAASFCIGTPVPAKPLRSGLDFGGAGWEVHPVAAGTVIFADEIPGGFGYGVIVDHGSNTDHSDGDLQSWSGIDGMPPCPGPIGGPAMAICSRPPASVSCPTPRGGQGHGPGPVPSACDGEELTQPRIRSGDIGGCSRTRAYDRRRRTELEECCGPRRRDADAQGHRDGVR